MNEIENKQVPRVKRRSQEEKRALCESWRISGKKISAFCKEQGFSTSTFHGWLNKLSIREPKIKKMHLKPVIVKDNFLKVNGMEQTLIEVVLPNQVILRLKLSLKELIPFIQELSYAAAIIR